MHGFSATTGLKPPGGIPKLKAIHITPAANGFQVQHHYAGGIPNPKNYVFPNADKLVSHVANTARQVWEGNKSGTPKLRGSMQAHREKQITQSEF